VSPTILLGEFPIVAHDVEQHRKQAVGGVVYFGYFLLDKQKKVTRKSRESDKLPNDAHRAKLDWIPACAGMTRCKIFC